MTNKEINEMGIPRYPKFKDACSQFSMDEIFKLAEAGYMAEVLRKGGVIDE